MKTIVIGASPNPDRYSYKATTMLNQYGHEVVPVGIRKGKIEHTDIIKGKPEITDTHTVTMYVGAARQPEYYDYILSLNPKRIIFNPGTENNELASLAKANGIETIEHCTLVMLCSQEY